MTEQQKVGTHKVMLEPPLVKCAELGCEELVVGHVDGAPACETHLAAEFERRVAAGEEVSLGEPETATGFGLVQKAAERLGVEVPTLGGRSFSIPLAVARPGSIVLYHSPLDPRVSVLLPAIVVATPESRAEAAEGLGRNADAELAWFPDFTGSDELSEPVHLAVFNPEPQRPLLFVPRVGRGEGAGEWSWA